AVTRLSGTCTVLPTCGEVGPLPWMSWISSVAGSEPADAAVGPARRTRRMSAGVLFTRATSLTDWQRCAGAPPKTGAATLRGRGAGVQYASEHTAHGLQ